MSRRYSVDVKPVRLWDIPIYITPSRISPWRARLAEGEQFTRAQLAAMCAKNIDPEACDVMVVRSVVTSREMWVPVNSFTRRQHYPDVLIDCPIVSRLRGLVQVISPIGTVESVQPDGRVRAPRMGWAA